MLLVRNRRACLRGFRKGGGREEVPLEQAIEAARREAKIDNVKVSLTIDGLTRLLLPGLESAVSDVNADSRVESRVKESMVDLWATCTETQDYWLRPPVPRGPQREANRISRQT